MDDGARSGLERLTGKERETLRLIARGHDAKSSARHLGVSVHTVNERLRAARAKLSTTSSREAARLLLDREEASQFLRPENLRDAEPAMPTPREEPSNDRAAKGRAALAVSGGLLMLTILAALALSTMPSQAPKDARESAASAADAAAVDAARDFLQLIDAARWAESYAATTERFRRLNTVAAWTAASEQARASLGAVQSRELLSQDLVPAPPSGYAMVKFRTRFATKPVVETVTLERDGVAWRVAGIVID